MKLVNPLQYPLAVLAGGVFLVAGVRLVQLPNVVALPGAVAIALTTSAILHSKAPSPLALNNPALSKELQKIRAQALQLTQTADTLKIEAAKVLTLADQIELLGTVEYVCDRTQEIPAQLDRLAQRLQGKDALLSAKAIETQLKDAQAKVKTSSSAVKTQWQTLVQQLKENQTLVQQGEDARQAQLIQLSTLVAKTEGVLQQLQNKLRTADLANTLNRAELETLRDELKGFQENIEVLMG